MASIQGVYLALFGRPADPIGLSFFNGVTNNGQNLTAIGDLATTQEYKDRFVGQSTTQIITSIYQSLFNRDPDLSGLSFFAAALTNGFITGANGVRIPVTVSNIAILIFDGAQGSDVTIRDTKVAAANAFTAGLDTVAEINGYSGNDAAAAGRAFISTVTTTAPTQAQVDAAIVAATTGIQINGQTFTLTNSGITGIGDAFKGGAANDLFNGNSPGSLNTGDVLDGGAGTDTLQSTIGASVTIQPTLTAIERLFTGVTGTNAAVLDLSKSSGYKELWTTTTGGNNDITYNAVVADTIIGLQSVGRGGVDIVVNGSAADATADVVLDTVGGGAAGARPNLTLNTGAATVNIVSQGAGNSRLNSLDVNDLAGVNDTMNKLVISGDKAVRIDNAITFNAADTKGEVDATKASGGVNLNLTQGGKDITATGGAGADRFNLGASLTVTDKLDGGAGRDTLAVATEGQIVTGLQAANFETLELTGALGGTLIASRVVGVDSVTLGGGSTGIIQGLKSGATVKYTAAATTTDIQLTDATKAGTADTLNLVVEQSGGGLNAGTVTAAGVETVTISSVKDSANTADAVNTVALNSAQVETVTITGTQALNLGTVNNTVKVIDGSGLTTANAALQVTVQAGNPAQGVAITGGAGNDILVGGDAGDTLVGGAGDDNLAAGQGAAPTPDVATIALGGQTFRAGDQVSITIDGITVTTTAPAASAASAAAALAGAIQGTPALAGVVASATANGSNLVLTSTSTGNTASFGAGIGNLGIDPAATTPALASAVTVPAAAATPSTGTLTFATAAGTFAAGQVVSATFDDAVAGGAVTVNYTVLAADIVAGDGTATAANVAQKFLGAIQADATLTDAGTAGITSSRAGNVISYTSETAGIAGANASWNTTAVAGITDANTSNGTADVAQTRTIDAAQFFVGQPTGSDVTVSFTIDSNGATPAYTVNANGTSATALAASIANAINAGDAGNELNNSTSAAGLVTVQSATPGAGSVVTLSANATVNGGPVAIATAPLTTTVEGVSGGLSGAVDTFTGGAGQDVFNFNVGSGTPGATITNIDVITDLDLGSAVAAGKVDTIDLSFGVATLVNAGVAVAAPAAATLTGAINALFGAGGALNGQANTAGLFTYGGDTYLVAANGAGAAFGADDVIVKVTGLTGTLDLTDFV